MYRTHQESLKRLRKGLSETSKRIRHRRHLINIHVAVLGWLTEFSGFFLIFLGSFLLGHGNAAVTIILQSFTIFLFFNVLPCIYLINDSDFKADIAETQFYQKFLKLFKCEGVDSGLQEEEDKDEIGSVEDNVDNER